MGLGLGATSAPILIAYSWQAWHKTKAGSMIVNLEEVCRTLPLSGRQTAWGGVAENRGWPVHSRGLLGSIEGFAGIILAGWKPSLGVESGKSIKHASCHCTFLSHRIVPVTVPI
jgi:hypothetical protein